MKTHNLTKAIYFAALIEIVLSLLWFSNHPDPSQTVLYIGFGCLLIIFGYIYEWMKRFQDEIEEQQKIINSLDLWVRQEFTKLKGEKKK